MNTRRFWVLVAGFLACGASAAELAVRERLVAAAAESGQLLALAKPSPQANYVEPLRLDEPQEPADRRFPTAEPAARYDRLRPWTRQYAARFAFPRMKGSAADDAPVWPTPADAPALRALLADKEPAVRGLAIEALATLHEPEDLPRIAQALEDSADGAPALSWNHYVVSMVMNERDSPEGVDLLRGWHPRKVRTYAKAALKLMTGEEFDAASFAKWWERNREGRQCLWFWQERLYRDLAVIAAIPYPAYQPAPGGPSHDEWFRQQQAERARRQQEVTRAVGAELSRLSPEVEAKVRLLAINRHTSALGTDLDGALMGPCDALRLPPERLLDLLERNGLWADVNWDGTHYNALVRQLAGSAEKLFQPAHLPRLRAVLERERGNLWWNAQAALHIGIARLLPPAKDANLDDPQTRDGHLRAAIRQPGDVFVRGTVARELVRVAVAPNWPFLEELCWAEGKTDGIPDLRMAVVQELGAAPLTPEKRTALAKLVLDKRYAPLWTRPLGRMGDDMHRKYAIWSVNAHAGKELLTIYDDQNLREPRTAEQTLTNVLKTVAEVLGSSTGARDPRSR